MSDPVTHNISSDDAAILSLNTAAPSGDGAGDETDSEDPVGRGASPTGKLDMFHGYLPKHIKTGTRGGNSEPVAGAFQLTPGARANPIIGPGRKLA